MAKRLIDQLIEVWQPRLDPEQELEAKELYRLWDLGEERADKLAQKLREVDGAVWTFWDDAQEKLEAAVKTKG